MTEQGQIVRFVAMVLLGKVTEIFSTIRDSSAALSSEWLHIPVVQEIHQFVSTLKIQAGLPKPLENPERWEKIEMIIVYEEYLKYKSHQILWHAFRWATATHNSCNTTSG